MIDGVNELQLYDLRNDPGEEKNVTMEQPEIVRKLIGLIDRARTDIGDCDRIGIGARFYDDAPRRPDIDQYISWLSGKSTSTE